ncbi:class I SAM-dependent methyltransferase [Bacteriovoracaceae bacterium]|nr:class I SAM-dependent methyltransferase [Bacteriovoracaceae bacterium]
MFSFGKTKIDSDLKNKLQHQIDDLNPWYQPIEFAAGLKTVPVTKNGDKVSLRDIDRGLRKWKKFIKPSLPFELEGKTILDCGCNAGLFLVQAIKEGASKCYGIEVDDHYHKQTHFVRDAFSEIDNKKYNIEIFQSSFEDFDYDQLGKVDITFFFNTIYHIGRATHADKSLDDILNIQSEMLKRVSKVTEYILFQSNAHRDEGRGKGKDSLHQIIDASGLEIVYENDYNHARGLMTLAKKK